MKFTVVTRFYDSGQVNANYHKFHEGDNDEKNEYDGFDEYIEIVYTEQDAQDLVNEALEA